MKILHWKLSSDWQMAKPDGMSDCFAILGYEDSTQLITVLENDGPLANLVKCFLDNYSLFN